MNVDVSPEVMNVDEVAAYLRVAPATIYRLAQQRKIPCGKVGRSWRFRKEAIDDWITEVPINSLAADAKKTESDTELLVSDG